MIYITEASNDLNFTVLVIPSAEISNLQLDRTRKLSNYLSTKANDNENFIILVIPSPEISNLFHERKRTFEKTLSYRQRKSYISCNSVSGNYTITA